jgi:tetratricopeptide (TPR) repeat protein
VAPPIRSTPTASSRIRDALERARACLVRGELRGAEFCFQQVLLDDPDNADALNGIGNLAIIAQRYDLAVNFHHRAVKSAPKDPGLLNDLANSLILAGQPLKALPHLRKALDRTPRLYPALLNQVRAYRDIDEPEKALAILDTIVAARPAKSVVDPIDLDLERALTLAQIGRFADALALFRAVLKARPDDPRAIDGIATGHRATESDNDLAAMQTALARPDLTPLQRKVTFRAAGKILEDLGRFDEAFLKFKQANDISAPFDMGRHQAFVAGSIRLFTRQFFVDRADFGDASEQPVFVVGLPRSGTTLLEQILASHPDVSGVGELPNIEQSLISAVPEAWGSTSFFGALKGLTPDIIRNRAKDYLTTLNRRGKARARVVDKMPHNFLVLGWIGLLFPKARIIHCMRDPMDVCVSCYCHHFSDAHSYSSNLQTLGQYHRLYERLMQHWAAELPIAMLDVRYEDVVRDLDQAARRMIDHLGLTWNEACLDFYRTQRAVHTPSQWQVRQPIFTSSVGRWRNYERHLQPLIESLKRESNVDIR